MHSCSLLSKNHLFNIEIQPKTAYYPRMVNGVKMANNRQENDWVIYLEKDNDDKADE